MKYRCQTLFDITATGVTGHYKSSSKIELADWNHARNQQRNWETITQILGLRTQVFGLVDPVQDISGNRWMFEFETESDGIYGPESDPVQVLRADAEGVPMLLNLGNQSEIDPMLVTSGPRQNIWFAPISINS
jgi:hypothetical protein